MEEAAAPRRKAPQLWALLRDNLAEAVDRRHKEELKAARLTHGLRRLGRIALEHPVRHVAYNGTERLLLVLDARGRLHVHGDDGRLLATRDAPGPVAGLLHAPALDRYVAWGPGGLQVLGPRFQVLSRTPVPQGIRCCLLVPALEQVVTAGDGAFAVWAFSPGGRRLRRVAAARQGLSPRDALTRLAADAGPGGPRRCFAACGTGVAEFGLRQGRLLARRRDLHSRAVADVAYSEAAGCVATASSDGTVKVWDGSWQLRSVFAGHAGPVRALAAVPGEPLLLSAARDGTLRAWSLAAAAPAGRAPASPAVSGLQVAAAGRLVCAFGGRAVELWRPERLYRLHARLGAAVARLAAAGPAADGFPARAVCVCPAAGVWVLEAGGGRAVSALPLGPPRRALQAVYCLPRETLFVLLAGGGILRAGTARSPAAERGPAVQPPGAPAPPCCLLLYSHVPDRREALEAWAEARALGREERSWGQASLTQPGKNRHLLFAGLADGGLCMLQWFTARVQCAARAHAGGPVAALAAHPAAGSIFSAGADGAVQQWRVAPYAEDSLSPLRAFACPHPAVQLCALGGTLAAALQDPGRSAFSVVHYDLRDGRCRRHRVEDDPLDRITGLCCCPGLKLFASASRDGSVKIWDGENRLLRHLQLNAVPESLAFGSAGGDLLLGLERDLYRIPASAYLPGPYLRWVLRGEQPEAVPEAPPEQPWGRAGSPPRAPAPHGPDDGSGPERRQALAQLSARDEDLLRLRQGRLRAAGRRPPGRALRDEAFQRYLRIYPPLPGAEVPAPLPKVPPGPGPAATEQRQRRGHQRTEPPQRPPKPSPLRPREPEGEDGERGGEQAKPARSTQSLEEPPGTPADGGEEAGTPAGTDEAEPARAARPLPPFIHQFQSTEWFEQVFPSLSLRACMEQASVDEFAHMLLEKLLTEDYGTKTPVLQALLTLYNQSELKIQHQLRDVLLYLLNQRNPPTMEEKTQKRFILTCFQALADICTGSKSLLLELMTYFLQTPVSSREPIKNHLKELGLQDPHDYFCKEMDSWGFSKETEVTKATLRSACAQWLEGAIQTLQDHKNRILNQERSPQSLPGTSEKVKGAVQSEVSSASRVFRELGRPIDAINHFCEMQLQRDLEALKEVKPAKKENGQAALQLGESKAMARRSPPQRFYLPHLFPQPLVKGFVRAVKLPLPKITLRPFQDGSGKLAAQNAFGVVDQKVQKYFFPKLSFADSYP